MPLTRRAKRGISVCSAKERDHKPQTRLVATQERDPYNTRYGTVIFES